MAQTVTLNSTGVASGDSAGSGIYAVGSTEGGTGHVYILNFPLNVDFSRKIITKIQVRGYRYVKDGGTGRNCILGFASTKCNWTSSPRPCAHSSYRRCSCAFPSYER